MAKKSKASAKKASAKTATTRPVTLKHLAHALAESNELTKKQGEAILNELVERITKHLKKGEKLRLTGLGVLQVRKRAWAAIPRPAKRSRSRPARKWRSAPPRN
jgi:DNA-binding protein HU-beta